MTNTIQQWAEKQNDSNTEIDISKAGIWDLMDAASHTNNNKFTAEEGLAELKKRGL